ncbi:MAG: hypothetical protein AAGJ35_10635, partial [Myxococcota bacterium]
MTKMEPPAVSSSSTTTAAPPPPASTSSISASSSSQTSVVVKSTAATVAPTPLSPPRKQSQQQLNHPSTTTLPRVKRPLEPSIPSRSEAPPPKKKSTTSNKPSTPRSSKKRPREEAPDPMSAFFLKHQNAALASELQQLQYQFNLLETERDARRQQCQDCWTSLQELEAIWKQLEVGLGISGKNTGAAAA